MSRTINAYGETVYEKPPTRRYMAEIQARIAAERARKIEDYRRNTKPPTRRYLETENPRRTGAGDPIPDNLELPMIDFADRRSLNGTANPCPTCRNPITSANGRCYRCKPSGGAGSKRQATEGLTPAQERRRERDRERQKRRTAEKRAAREALVKQPAPAPALPSVGLGRELAAINAIAAAIEGLPRESVAWVLSPFVREFKVNPAGVATS